MADDLLSALTNNETLDEDAVLHINPEDRTIRIPKDFVFGVYNDKDVLAVPFTIPRYYGENDLSDFTFTINYINGAGLGNIYDVVDLTVGEDRIDFTWTLGRAVFVTKGAVRFVVCIRKIGSGGRIQKELNTRIYVAEVLAGLEVDDNPDPEAYSILANMTELEASTKRLHDFVADKASEIANITGEATRALNEANEKLDEATEGIERVEQMFSSPLVAATVSAMTDQTRVYVYTGSETGYTFGNWYYYDGSAWTSGGVYNSQGINTDTTLTIAGMAADAKATGDEIAGLKSDLNELGTVPNIEGASESADLFITDPSGNMLAEFKDGHFKVKAFDSSLIPTVQEFAHIVEQISIGAAYDATTKSAATSGIDLDVVDSQGNVLLRLANGHIYTKYFDSTLTDQNAVKMVNHNRPDAGGNVDVVAQLNPEELQDAVDTFLTEHPVVAAADGIVSVADYGAIGDGITDDSAAIQNAINANYNIYFESNKTYYLATPVTITTDKYLHGGINSTIKTKLESDGLHNGFSISGTLKTTATLTSNYVSYGEDSLENVGNRFTLDDMSSVAIGDIIVIRATDQYYSYSRRYYYLGATLLVTDIYDGHIYTNRSMPWDIMLTSNLKVYVYNAPTVKIENLHFVSDLNVFGSEFYNSYSALVSMSYCKNSEFLNCEFNHMKIGAKVEYCVNTLLNNVSLSKSRYANTERLGDGYGIDIVSCTHTTMERILSLCAQGCIDLGGDIPCIDTFISKCDVSSECRSIGIDMHDNSYNIVIEDCTLGGLSLFGTAYVNRCQFIKNIRGGGYGSLTFRGFADPRWARLHVSNCSFPPSGLINLRAQAPQDYIQGYHSIIDSVIIENCTGGTGIQYDVTASEFVLSSTVNELIIRNWDNVQEIYHTGIGVIKYLELNDCRFTHQKYINMHRDAFDVSGIYHTIIKNTHPYKCLHLANAENTRGGTFVLPENVPISVSSDDSLAEYIVCGDNYASTDDGDYSVGSISGNSGTALTRTPDSTAQSYLTSDAGGLIYTLPADYSSNKAIYPKCYIFNNSGLTCNLKAKAKITNIGNTSGNNFRLYIVIVDTITGLIVYRGNGTSAQATEEGVELTHSHNIDDGCFALFYLSTYETVSGSATKISQMYVTMTPYDFPTPADSEHTSHKIIGDGTLLSFSGKNNIMSSADVFNLQFTADYSKSI